MTITPTKSRAGRLLGRPPTAALGRAYRRALTRPGRASPAKDPQGVELREALSRTLSGSRAMVSLELPSGGLALWVRVRDERDLDRRAARALEQGVSFRPGRHFPFDGAPVAAFRIGLSRYSEQELEVAARRIGAALEGPR